MAILNIFKNKKEEKKVSKKDNSVKEVKEISKKITDFSMPKRFFSVSAHITEKSTNFEKDNKYVLRVPKTSNKVEIKKEIENNHKVNVLSVKVINVRKKKRRLGKHEGYKKGYKKAIIEIKEGEKIDLA